MENNHTGEINVRGFALSNIAVCYLFLYFFAGMFSLLLALVALRAFSTVEVGEWVLFIPVLLPTAILVVHLLSCLYSVTLSKDMVTVRWFGSFMRTVPASSMQLICASGDQRDDVLCLSCYTVEQLAQLQEKRYSKNILEKYNVPLLKRNPRWQENFAAAYMTGLRKSPFGMLTDPGVVQLPMSAALLYKLSQLYPRLPYRNFTAVTSEYTSRYNSIRENEAFSFATPLYASTVQLEPDGLHLFCEKKETLFIPAQELKSAIRVDIFRSYDKFHPHHRPLLLISRLTELELASRVPSQEYTGIDNADQNRCALLAMMAATNLAIYWNRHQTEYVVMHFTENNLQLLRECCPHIRLNTLSAYWLQDRESGDVAQ